MQADRSIYKMLINVCIHFITVIANNGLNNIWWVTAEAVDTGGHWHTINPCLHMVIQSVTVVSKRYAGIILSEKNLHLFIHSSFFIKFYNSYCGQDGCDLVPFTQTRASFRHHYEIFLWIWSVLYRATRCCTKN